MDKRTAFIVKTGILSAIFLVALIVSLVFILIGNKDGRYVLLFESLDDQDVHAEVRYLDTIPYSDEVTTFVRELLLGPATNRYRPLFSKSVSLESCILRDGVLYIDLSEEASVKEGSSSETERACSLLKENINLNFKKIEAVNIFISGIEAYREESVLTVSDN